ncbi:hypothetical protein SO802_004002 [Lithocarpus litseifolius]|uniref:Reverse transcriptase domain-containing protein n=1 Tax=Lithocarpus litseifolius TaxID=425828 RepID=A0AAW2E590_9ROSI
MTGAIPGAVDGVGRLLDSGSEEESLPSLLLDVLEVERSSHPMSSSSTDTPSSHKNRIEGEDMNSKLITNLVMSCFAIKALHQMQLTKAPGPNGMSAIFYLKYWNIVGSDISNMALKTILPQIIMENQSAFTSDRLISDNVLVAFELMHYLNQKKKGKDSLMSIKLDMSKAFDRVEWDFIKKVMERLISPHPRSCPQQSDQWDFHLPGVPIITHLFFADNSLLFCKANTQESKNLVEILGKYEAASGQKVNTGKSSVFFSPNTTPESRGEILNILGPMQGTWHNKYLGLPSIIGKSKSQVFVEIKEKVGKKLAGWKEKLLCSSSANLHHELLPTSQKPL